MDPCRSGNRCYPRSSRSASQRLASTASSPIQYPQPRSVLARLPSSPHAHRNGSRAVRDLLPVPSLPHDGSTLHLRARPEAGPSARARVSIQHCPPPELHGHDPHLDRPSSCDLPGRRMGARSALACDISLQWSRINQGATHLRDRTHGSILCVTSRSHSHSRNEGG
jgi:hypothetical protein